MPEIKWRELSSAQHKGPHQPDSRTQPPRVASLYDVLEVSPQASLEVIKAAYRVLIGKYHPDRQADHLRRWAEEISCQLNAAYAIVGNPQRRIEYDRKNSIAGRN